MKHFTFHSLSVLMAAAFGFFCPLQKTQAMGLPEVTNSVQADGDTIVNVSGVRRVVMTECDSSVVLSIRGCEGDSTFRFDYHKEYGDRSVSTVESRANRWDFSHIQIGMPRKEKNDSARAKSSLVFFYGIGFGWVNVLDAPEGWDFRMGRSIEFFGNILGYNYRTKNRRHSFSLGMGVKFTRLVLDDKQLIEADDNRYLYPSQYPAGYKDEGASLNMTGFMLNGRYSWRFAKNWSLAFSPSIDFNTRARVRSHYTVGNRETSTTIKGLKRKVITGSFLAAINYKEFGLYAKYTPWSVLDTNYGPKVANWSIGVSMNF